MSNIAICITYYNKNCLSPVILKLKPEEYFESDEEYDVDSVPLYDNILDYIMDSDKITKIILLISNYSNNKKLQIDRYYWNNQHCFMAIRKDYCGELITNQELIFETVLPDAVGKNSKMYNLSRFVVSNQELNCTYQGVFVQNEDGSENEYRII